MKEKKNGKILRTTKQTHKTRTNSQCTIFHLSIYKNLKNAVEKETLCDELSSSFA
jgi:hypothetical protein